MSDDVMDNLMLHPVAYPPVGRLLKARRDVLGYSLAEASDHAQMSEKTLRLIESESFHDLPEPVFAMPVVFAWAVIRPSMLAPLGVMFMGIFLDFLWGTPTALWAVCLLLPYGLVLSGRSDVPLLTQWAAVRMVRRSSISEPVQMNEPVA